MADAENQLLQAYGSGKLVPLFLLPEWSKRREGHVQGKSRGLARVVTEVMLHQWAP